MLTGDRGSFRLAKPLDTIQVPATVQAMLAARIDRLPPATKDLLQCAAVIGKTVPFTLLETVAGIAPAELRHGLAQLQAAEFLYETSLFPDLEYTFKHALTLEVAYQTLLRERRRLLHALVLTALEQRVGEDAIEDVETLAHHAVRGEAWPPAARYLYRAGAKAQAEARYATAMHLYEQAIEALRHLADKADRSLELDAYLELWSTKISNSQLAGLHELGLKVEALARALDDGPRLARVQVRQAQAIAFAGAIPGTLDVALDLAREAAGRADPSDLRTRSYARFIAAIACRDIGRMEEAIQEFDRGVELFANAADTPQQPGFVYPIFVSLCGWRAEALAALGRFDAALRSATDGFRMATQIRHVGSASIASAFLGYVHVLRGIARRHLCPRARLGHLGRARAGTRHLRQRRISAGPCCWQGTPRVGSSASEHALERPGGGHVQWTRFGTVTAAAYLEAGRPDKARPALSDGAAAMHERGAGGYRASLLRLEGELLLHDGEAIGAREFLERALSAAGALGAIPEIGHCHVTLSKIAAELGDAAAAQRHLAAAQQTFKPLGLGFWLSRGGR